MPPLRRHTADWPICYESAIALKFAARQPRSRSAPGTVPPAALAAEIAAAGSIEGWQIQARPSGILRFQASEPTIAATLQRWLTVRPGCTAELPPMQSFSTDQLFQVQYVHARCWMLLRSAAREGWFEQFDLPPDLPWLTSTGKLRLQHTTERQAIGLLFDAVDALALERTGDRLWKQAVSLSHQLDAFQSACRVWGEVKTQDLPLAQARLGLTWAGQAVLQVLLNRLGLDAPRFL
ncbi:MAG: hypothetical protein HC895_25470 [Leptolyngbyaceae cyanobacterium SM1_3_5]|nr:hypothetical protein [Leptolyngbyaceae cyanobacterium SM1_3_5]